MAGVKLLLLIIIKKQLYGRAFVGEKKDILAQ